MSHVIEILDKLSVRLFYLVIFYLLSIFIFNQQNYGHVCSIVVLNIAIYNTELMAQAGYWMCISFQIRQERLFLTGLGYPLFRFKGRGIR